MSTQYLYWEHAMKMANVFARATGKRQKVSSDLSACSHCPKERFYHVRPIAS